MTPFFSALAQTQRAFCKSLFDDGCADVLLVSGIQGIKRSLRHSRHPSPWHFSRFIDVMTMFDLCVCSVLGMAPLWQVLMTQRCDFGMLKLWISKSQLTLDSKSFQQATAQNATSSLSEAKTCRLDSSTMRPVDSLDVTAIDGCSHSRIWTWEEQQAPRPCAHHPVWIWRKDVCIWFRRRNDPFVGDSSREYKTNAADATWSPGQQQQRKQGSGCQSDWLMTANNAFKRSVRVWQPKLRNRHKTVSCPKCRIRQV